MIKKLLVYLTCLLATIAPIQAYAINLSKGQIIQMGKQGGAYIKTAGGVAMKIGGFAKKFTYAGVFAYCMKNQKKCSDFIDDAFEFACEKLSGDEDNCTISRKEEVDDESGQCIVRYGSKKQTLSSFIASVSTTEDRGAYTIRYYANSETTEQLKLNARRAIKSTNKNSSDWGFYHGTYRLFYTTTDKASGNTVDDSETYYAQTWVKCGGQSDDDKKLSDSELEELAKKIAKNMDDDDIKNYYNYDYGDITINNNHYDGDEINNQTNIEKQCQQYSCNEISKEIEQDINNKKYDIDDVNEQNCTMENKKYISCNVKKSDDDDTNNNQDDTTNNQDNTKKDDDDEPHWCKTSDLTKEACEFFDWVDDEPEKPKNTKVDVEDEEEKLLDDDMINIMKSCPADIEFSVSMLGQSMEFEISTMPFCLVAKGAKSYIISAGTLSAIFILAGVRRD